MNNQIPETDQWKLSGNCEKCRRANYCTKKCGAKKARIQGLYNALGNAMIDAIKEELPKFREYFKLKANQYKPPHTTHHTEQKNSPQ